MNMEFKNAAFDAAGTATGTEQTIAGLPSPTDPAPAGGAGQRMPEPQVGRARSDNSPTGERDVPQDRRNPDDTSTSRENPAATPGEQATEAEKSSYPKPVPTNPPCGAGDDAIKNRKPIHLEHHPTHPASAGGGGHGTVETHPEPAAAQVSASDGGGDAPVEGSKPWLASASHTKSRRKAGEVGADPNGGDTNAAAERPDLRFSDPLVAEIVQLHRMRRRWMKAKNALILQGKAFGRAVCDGDKEAGSAAFDRVIGGKAGPGDDTLIIALAPFAAAIARFDEDIGPIEKRLVKLAKGLPIAPFVESVKGLGWSSVATIVGEAGDLSAYPSVAGVWKRMGLAVIDGDGRQRKVADADRAMIHGYNPERRSVVWNAGNNVIGGMGNGKRPLSGEDVDGREDWTPYEKLFVHRLRYEAARDPAMRLPDTKEGKESYTRYAAARAKRYVEKRMLKDMTLAWRRAVGQSSPENQSRLADRPICNGGAQ